MNDRWHIHLLWFVWLVLLTTHVFKYLPGTFSLKTSDSLIEYKVIGVLPTNNPYLKIPVYIAKKDMRSWAFMRSVDKVIPNV